YRKRGDTKPVLSSAEAKAVADALGPRRKITLKRVAKYGIRQTPRVSKRLADKLEQRARMMAINTYQRVEFQKGDVLFIPWGEWWDPNFIQRLKDWHKAGVRLAPIIHDVGPMVVPQFLGQSTDSLADYTRNIVPISAVTLAVSQNTKKDLTRWLQDQHLPVPRIDVFRLGEDFEFS